MPTLSVSRAAADSQPVTPPGPSMCFKLIQIFSAFPFLKTILGSTVAVMGFSWPSCSMTQLAVCGGTHNLNLPLVTAATIVARLMLSSTEQRASPKPHVSSVRSASLMVDLAQVLLSLHVRSSPL